jgi:carboxyl-terminal processing protease
MSSRRTPLPGWLRWLPAGLALLAIGLLLGGHPGWLPGPIRSVVAPESANQKLVDQVLGLLQKDYYRPVNRTTLDSTVLNGGLTAAVASLNDPYSRYISPADYGSFQNQDNPHLSGIGVDVNKVADGLEIVDVFPGSPAAKGGLVSGDVIIAVGATLLANHTQDYAASLIKGRAGTRVTLTIERGKRRRTVTLVRADIVVPVASGKLLHYHGDTLGYVQLTSFTTGSGAQVRAQVTKVLRGGAKGLILDLRDNGGGLLQEAVNVASAFIQSGTIVSTDGRAQPRHVYYALGNAIAPKIPMVVLVDQGTASSAEIVTGALKDRGRAEVIGTRTYGKGVFQEIQPLPNGGALDFTVGEYFTPNGQNLGGGGVNRGSGIQPNVYAFTKPSSQTDTALTVAESTVASELR